MSILKPEFYDKFQCIADKCTFTCCRDWHIPVDPYSFQAYQEAPEIACKIHDLDERHVFDAKEDGTCAFLMENGLCQLVCTYGPDILCKTCAQFPRLEVIRKDMTEQTLNCGCPAVLQLLRETPTPMQFILDDSDDLPSNPPAEDSIENDNLQCDVAVLSKEQQAILDCRNYVIDLLQISDLPLWNRMLLVYQFTKQLSENPQDYVAIMDRYNSPEYLLKLVDTFHDFKISAEEKYTYGCNLFYCLNSSIRRKKNQVFSEYIGDIWKFLEQRSSEDLASTSQEFVTYMQQEATLLENLSVNVYYSLCGNAKSFQELHENACVTCIEISGIIFTYWAQWLRSGKTIDERPLLNIASYYARNVNNHTSQGRAENLEVFKNNHLLHVRSMILGLKYDIFKETTNH